MLNGLFLKNQATTATDPYFPYVGMLLPGNGSNGAQNNTFVDSSSNAFTVTRNGNTTQGSFSPYGSRWSNYFDGSGDYLEVPSNTAFAYGTGDLTLECWLYRTSTIDTGILENRSGGGMIWYINGSGYMSIYDGTGFYDSNTVVPTNRWVHLVACRQSGTLRYFLDGVAAGSMSWTTNITSPTTLKIMRSNEATQYAGYASNLRIVKGTAVYTANFTPPTSPLTAISGTSLLTCQSNRFRDASTNNFTITGNGDVAVTGFSPFSPSAAYSTTTNGGSAYFDGSGDFLQYTGSSANELGSGNFTIEFWVNAPLLNDKFFINLRGGMNGAPHLTTGGYDGTTAGALRWVSDDGTITSGSTVVTDNTWHHCAVVRNGTTITLYVDGVSQGSGTDTVNYSTNGGTITVGSNGTGGGNPFQGYLSNLRIVKGTAVYTAAFTPPTAPVTAISGTSLLLNATNAAIYDAAAINDLETVGNAQTSTTQSKFGGSSMYFDGTGDWLKFVASPQYAFGTGDFTLEGWFYPTASANQALFDTRNNSTSSSGIGVRLLTSTNTLRVIMNNTALFTTSTAVTLNTWSHIAIVRSSGTVTAYLNGTAMTGGSASGTTSLTDTSLWIGELQDTGYQWNGYMDDLRITKGVARYTANFTPPTAAFPVQ